MMVGLITSKEKHVGVDRFEIFNDHWVVTERENGLTRIKVKRWDETEDYFIPVSGITSSPSVGCLKLLKKLVSFKCKFSFRLSKVFTCP